MSFLCVRRLGRSQGWSSLHLRSRPRDAANDHLLNALCCPPLASPPPRRKEQKKVDKLSSQIPYHEGRGSTEEVTKIKEQIDAIWAKAREAQYA